MYSSSWSTLNFCSEPSLMSCCEKRGGSVSSRARVRSERAQRAGARASRRTELSCVASIDCWWCPPSETTRRKRSDWPLFIFLMSITWRERPRARPGEGGTRGSSARAKSRAHPPPHLDVRVEARVAVRDALERSRGQHVCSERAEGEGERDGCARARGSRVGLRRVARASARARARTHL